jgi:hypothetical protein
VPRTNDPLPSNDAVEAAIARVLAAEEAARAVIARTHDEAAAGAEAARATTRTVYQRLESRIAAVRARFDRHVSTQVAAMEAEAAALAAAPELAPAEIAELERALAALAAELIGYSR